MPHTTKGKPKRRGRETGEGTTTPMSEEEEVEPTEEIEEEAERGKGGKQAQPEPEGKSEQERTSANKRLFLTCWESTLGSVKDACEQSGVGRTTFERWRGEDPEFRRALQELEVRKAEDVERQLNLLIQKGNGESVRFWLDRRHPDYRKDVKRDPGGSLEDDFDDDVTPAHGNPEGPGQPGVDAAHPPHPQQAGAGGAVPVQRGAVPVLGEEDAP